MKKYSWIVALFLALSLSALFISCGVDPIVSEPPEGVTYREVLLDNGMNIWAGGREQQQGWATGDGFKFKGVGDKPETAKDLGYKAEDFKAAEFLVFELQEGAPKGGVEIIWGAAEGNDKGISGWNSTKLTTDNGEVNSGVGVTVSENEEGAKIWKIALKTALSNYGQYKNADEVKILLQYYTDKGIPSLYVANSGKLLIPNTPPEPFVAITNITLANNTFNWANTLKLQATITPANATNQVVRWAIKSFLADVKNASDKWVPGDPDDLIYVHGDPTAPDVEEEDKDGNDIADTSYNASAEILRGYVSFVSSKGTEIEEVTDVWPFSSQKKEGVSKVSADTIKGKAFTPGTITVVAFVEGGGEDGEDYTQEFKITVTDVTPLVYKINGDEVYSVAYGAVDNNAGKGSKLELTSDSNGITVDLKDEYGNAYYFIEVDFGTETLGDYKGVKFNYEGVDGDFNYKTIRIMATKDKDSIKGYNPGGVIAIQDSGDAATATEVEGKFGVGEIDLGYPDPLLKVIIPAGLLQFRIAEMLQQLQK